MQLSCFSYYIINEPLDDAICNIAIYADDTTFYSNVIMHLICCNN